MFETELLKADGVNSLGHIPPTASMHWPVTLGMPFKSMEIINTPLELRHFQLF